VDPPLVVVKNCKKKLSAVQSRYTDDNAMVDYEAMGKDPDWSAFKEATCELQKIDMIGMEPNLKVAFVINLYNMTVIFAFAELGIPYSNWTRLSFFDEVKVNVGGHLWSLNDLESGILRANRAAPYHISKPFGPSDPRLAAALPMPEPRIHFALNCGAKSCPPVKNFTAEAIQEELRIVAMAFCEMQENIQLQSSGSTASTLWVSKIFEWYKVDFGGGGVETAKVVKDWLRGKPKEDLQVAIDARKLRVKSMTYDWSTNASRSLKYNGSVPKASAQRAGQVKAAQPKQEACCSIQ
jgi:hypothetical protein